LSSEVDKLVRECVRKKEIEIAEKLKKYSQTTCDVVGKWEVVCYTDKTLTRIAFQDCFELFKDCKASSSRGLRGTWSIKGTAVIMQWDAGHWESFNLPIMEEVTGSSWYDHNRVLKAKKIIP
jgi:hypothetical protein